MIEEIYLKQVSDTTAVVSFEGDLEDIYRVRDYIKHIDEEPVCVENSNNAECDAVNHPSHYTSSGMECIDEMILLYGEEETMHFCKLNAHKYRKRAFDKGGKEDMEKSDWYLAKYKELKDIVAEQRKNKHDWFIKDMATLLNNGASLHIEESGFANMCESIYINLNN